MKYFIANKELDYLRGYSENTVYSDGRIKIAPGVQSACFFSRVYDSLNTDTVWHRFRAKGINIDSSAVRYTVYAFDEAYIVTKSGKVLINEYIHDGNISISEKKKTLQPFLKKHVTGEEDFLLFDVKGRYLVYLCELYAREDKMPEIESAVIFFPKESWISLLPSVYSEDSEAASFTERFLAIFQSIYDDLNMNISSSECLLDSEFNERQMLEKVAEWFGFKYIYLWPDDRLRLLIKNAYRVTSLSGTVEGLLLLLELYTGKRPSITECFRIAKEGTAEEKRIYGVNRHEFVITIDSEFVSSAEQYKRLMCIILQGKPAHMNVRIRPVIGPGSDGESSYLGINTSLGTREEKR